jgi:hypothetical protein
MKKTRSLFTRKRKTNGLNSVSSRPNISKRSLGLFVVLFAAIAAFVIFQVGAAPAAAVTLSLSPSSQRMQVGATLSIAIKLNTNGQSVNTVQASLSYAPDKFEFVSIDGTNSAFAIDAQSGGASGMITVARGSITSVNSTSAHVATVNLRAIASGRKSQIRFMEDSLVLRSSDSVNILQKKVNGSYTIQ